MNSKIFKSPILRTSLFVALISGMVSCGNEIKTNDDTKEVAEKANDAKFDSSKNEWDAQFLVNAAEISLEEIKLGQMAQHHAKSQEIKALGQMMVDGHTKALNDLKGLAQSKTISLPDSATKGAQDAYDNLVDKKGQEFDRKYCDMMVDGHKEAISKYEKAASEAHDPQIKQWATTMIPDLRKHLDQSLACQNKLVKK